MQYNTFRALVFIPLSINSLVDKANHYRLANTVKPLSRTLSKKLWIELMGYFSTPARVVRKKDCL